MATQGKIRLFKRENKKGIIYGYSIEAGRNPLTGKRTRITKSGFKTQKEARQAAQSIINKLIAGENIIESTLMFNEFSDIFLKDYGLSVKPQTQICVAADLKTAKKYFGYRKLKDITPYMYQQMINDYAKDHSKYTVRRFISSTMKLFNYAKRYEFITRNPATNVVLPKFEQNIDIESLYLSKTELQQVLNLAKEYRTNGSDYFYPICVTMAYTGMRIGEACALLWSNIDFENKTITIESTMFALKNDEYIRQVTPKTKSSIRKIVISDTLISVLKEWKVKQNTLRIQRNTEYNRPKLDFVFTKYRKGMNKEYPALVKNFEITNSHFREKHHFQKNIHAHIFRHTHVSLLAEAGISLEVIKERLGHSNSQTTTKVYYHVTKKLKDTAAVTFDEYLKS